MGDVFVFCGLFTMSEINSCAVKLFGQEKLEMWDYPA